MLGIICDTNLTVFFSFLTPSLKSFQQSFYLLEIQWFYENGSVPSPRIVFVVL